MSGRRGADNEEVIKNVSARPISTNWKKPGSLSGRISPVRSFLRAARFKIAREQKKN